MGENNLSHLSYLCHRDHDLYGCQRRLWEVLCRGPEGLEVVRQDLGPLQGNVVEHLQGGGRGGGRGERLAQLGNGGLQQLKENQF